MTSFLGDDLDGPVGGSDYGKLGYLANPFPPQGSVTAEVCLPRDELSELRASLLSFLKDGGHGRFWALQGEPGYGKSNFLQHLDWDLTRHVEAGRFATLAHRYVATQQVAPRYLTQQILESLGAARLKELAAVVTEDRVAASMRDTDLGRFFAAVEAERTQGEDDDDWDHDTWAEEVAEFFIRWVGGHQTYAAERRRFQVVARDRMAPAIGFGYLAYLLDLLAGFGIVERLVLLLDEFEDVQSLSKGRQNEYLMAVKGMVNAFNRQRLFLVVAGQRNAFTALGQKIPSLSDRWERVSLKPLTSVEQAVRLAQAYKDHAHAKWCAAGEDRERSANLEPSDLVVKATYAELTNGTITPRELLHRLHQWVETEVRSP